MVLNLITWKISSFKPGLDCRKKTLPLFTIIRIKETIRKIGNKIINPVKAIKKSRSGLKNEQYIIRNLKTTTHFLPVREEI
jgi:hypothetical protein